MFKVRKNYGNYFFISLKHSPIIKIALDDKLLYHCTFSCLCLQVECIKINEIIKKIRLYDILKIILFSF